MNAGAAHLPAIDCRRGLCASTVRRTSFDRGLCGGAGMTAVPLSAKTASRRPSGTAEAIEFTVAEVR